MPRKRRTWMPDDPMPYLLTFRVGLVTGRYGGGKTSLCVWWAHRLLSDGYASRVMSNIPLSLPGMRLACDYPRRPDHWEPDSVVLYDEAWLELGQGSPPSAVRSFLAYLRKDNCYLLLPSVLPMARQIVGLTVERVFNAYGVGLPFWFYFWELPRGQERGTMIWWHPSRVWGWYDTDYKPTDRWFLYERELSSSVSSEYCEAAQ